MIGSGKDSGRLFCFDKAGGQKREIQAVMGREFIFFLFRAKNFAVAPASPSFRMMLRPNKRCTRPRMFYSDAAPLRTLTQPEP